MTALGVLIVLFILFILIVAIAAWKHDERPHHDSDIANYGGDPGPQYYYGRKSADMTQREAKLFWRLERIVQDKYYVFPQLHLSALMQNKTVGKYRKLAFQRINRTSVDYVLCDKRTMAPVYVVELDDTTHDSYLRRKRDAGVSLMLERVGIPLVRFRDVEKMSDNEIVTVFKEVAGQSDRQ